MFFPYSSCSWLTFSHGIDIKLVVAQLLYWTLQLLSDDFVVRGDSVLEGWCGVNFAEQPPSKQWAALKFRGETFAEVWFKPEGEPLALRFRIPRNSFHIPDIAERLTIENLLKAVAIATEEVESWRHGDFSSPGLNGSNPELKNPLPEPPQDVSHLEIHVRLVPPTQPAGITESSDLEITTKKWQDLEARWKSVLGLEAAMDTLRISMEGVRAELEAWLKRTLTTEERVHALSSDVLQWNKTRARIHYALPKTREFIHRATWAKGAPERKRLEELFKNHVGDPMPAPEMEQVLQELEVLRKDRQVLSAQGVTVHQECKALSADVQGALSRLHSNAASRASEKRRVARTQKKKG